MNILISSIYSHDSYARGIMPDVLQSTINAYPEATIYYLTNSWSFDVCYFNIKSEPDVCYRCKTGVNNTLKLVSGNFIHLKIKDLIKNEDVKMATDFFQDFATVSFDDKYENFEVGAATLSTYISRTRDRDLQNVQQNFVKELAVNALSLYLASKRFIEEKSIDRVLNFNGRHGYVRAIMRASIANKIDCYNIERARVGGYIEYYKNVLPHNILDKKLKVESCWKNSLSSEDEKVAKATEFFHRQRAGESVIFPSYIKNQRKNSLPDILSAEKDFIVLFTSSDDEFAAMGDEFKNPVFQDQKNGIEFLVSTIGRDFPETNLVIRMHPNLSDLYYSYVTEIKEMHQKYPNVFVVFPESNVDSYALINGASKVISFGSTLGLEANFWRKPVILLGKCFYYYSNVAYIPQNKSELVELLKIPKLECLPVKGALLFGFYYLQGGSKADFYHERQMGEGIFFKGERIHGYSLFQRGRSKIIQILYRNFGIRFSF